MNQESGNRQTDRREGLIVAETGNALSDRAAISIMTSDPHADLNMTETGNDPGEDLTVMETENALSNRAAISIMTSDPRVDLIVTETENALFAREGNLTMILTEI